MAPGGYDSRASFFSTPASRGMIQPSLVEPSETYRQSFIEAVKEFQADSYPLNTGGMGKYKDVLVEDLETDFASYLNQLADFAAGRNLKPDFVPASHRRAHWL